MPLTKIDILSASTDDGLFALLAEELEDRVPAQLHDNLDEFVARIRLLPPGLRAMAATYKLDVSITLDDLGWHFANGHNHSYCNETYIGLKELGAGEVAELFKSAYDIVHPYWNTMADLLNIDFGHFIEWYGDSELERQLGPINDRILSLQQALPHGLYSYWLSYALLSAGHGFDIVRRIRSVSLRDRASIPRTSVFICRWLEIQSLQRSA